MTRYLAAAAALFLIPAAAQAQDLEGSWAYEIDDTAIFVFTVEEGEDEWTGTWMRPSSFRSDGRSFMAMRGPVERVDSMAGIEFAGLVELSFDDPRPGAVPDIFRFKLLDEDHAEMTYVGTDLAPYLLTRVEDGAEPGPWDFDTTYRRKDPEEEFAGIGESEAEEDRPRLGDDFL